MVKDTHKKRTEEQCRHKLWQWWFIGHWAESCQVCLSCICHLWVSTKRLYQAKQLASCAVKPCVQKCTDHNYYKLDFVFFIFVAHANERERERERKEIHRNPSKDQTWDLFDSSVTTRQLQHDHTLPLLLKGVACKTNHVCACASPSQHITKFNANEYFILSMNILNMTPHKPTSVTNKPVYIRLQ